MAVGTFLTIFLALKSWAILRDVTSPKIDRPAISVTGEGKVFVKPNIGQVHLAVVTEADTVDEAQSKATNALNRVMAVLRESRVQDKDIKTTNYSITPKYDSSGRAGGISYPSRGAPYIVGYTVSQNLEVKLRDLGKAGEIITKAAQAGANQVGGITFTTEDPKSVQAEARIKAIEDAQKKAKALEERLGIRLGRVIGFDEFGGPYPVYRNYAMGKGGGEAAVAPEIPVGENEVVVNITVTYQIK